MTTGPDDRTTETLFARYRARGDADALGEVFDRTAPSLLRIALHLCRDPHCAEDLLQATFVKAIERAATWNDERPLLPWLTGILGNEARMLREREGRTPDPARLPPQTTEDPAVVIESRELTAAVDEAIAALPSTYRPVLRLHLAHGKHPAEIAHVLDCPPATVRSQLARGLQQLRKLLPIGIGAAASAQVGAGLPSVRAAVMAKAGGPGTTAAIAVPGAALGGGLLMKKGLATLALVLLGALWWAWPTSGSPLSLTPTDPASAAVAASIGREDAPATAASAPESDSGRRTDVATPRALAPTEAMVTGRCVDDDGNPLANASVRLNAEIDTSTRPAPDGLGDPNQRIFTAADGRFSFRFEPHPRWDFELHVIPEPPHVGGSMKLTEVREGLYLDLGDLAFPHGVMVSGSVRTPDGAPSPHASVWPSAGADVVDFSRRRGGDFEFSTSPPGAHSDSSGAFRIERPLVPGTWEFLTNADFPIEIALSGTEQVLELVNFHPIRHIRGTLVDPAGRPIEGVAVSADAGHSGSGSSSDAHGRFHTMRAGADPDAPFALVVRDHRYQVLQTDPIYRWGQDDVHLVLHRAPRLILAVTRADDGRPVESYRARLEYIRPSNRWRHHNWAWNHPGGILDVPVHAGDYAATIEPDPALGLAPSLPLQVTIGDVPVHRLEIRLAPEVAQSIAVLTTDGQPMEGSTVELLLPSAPGIELLPHLAFQRNHGPASRQPVQRLDRATTDEAGIAAVRGRGDTIYTLRVTSTRHAPLVIPDVRLTASRRTVEVMRGGTFSLTLLPLEIHGDLREQAGLPREGELEPALLRKLPGLQLRFGDDSSRPFVPRSHTDARFDSTGTATIRGLPPGRWTVFLSEPQPRSRMTLPLEITVDLADGQVTHRTLDASDRRRGRLRGRVLLDGRPFEGRLGFEPVGAEVGGREATANADGRFEALLPPGAWQIGAFDPKLRRSGSIFSPRVIHVDAGGHAERDFAIHSGRLTARLRDHAGRPVTDVAVRFERSDVPFSGWGSRLDADGCIESIEAAGSVHLVISTYVDGQQVPDPPFRAGPFEITPEGNEVEVRLPEGFPRSR